MNNWFKNIALKKTLWIDDIRRAKKVAELTLLPTWYQSHYEVKSDDDCIKTD